MWSKSPPWRNGFVTSSRRGRACGGGSSVCFHLPTGSPGIMCSGCSEISSQVSRFRPRPERARQRADPPEHIGVTVGCVVVPQSMAYALLAKLEPQFGLYSSFMGVLIYWFFATSKDITIGVGVPSPISDGIMLTGVAGRGDVDSRRRRGRKDGQDESGHSRACGRLGSRHHLWRHHLLHRPHPGGLDRRVHFIGRHIRFHDGIGHQHRRGPGSEPDGHHGIRRA